MQAFRSLPPCIGCTSIAGQTLQGTGSTEGRSGSQAELAKSPPRAQQHKGVENVQRQHGTGEQLWEPPPDEEEPEVCICLLSVPNTLAPLMFGKPLINNVLRFDHTQPHKCSNCRVYCAICQQLPLAKLLPVLQSQAAAANGA